MRILAIAVACVAALSLAGSFYVGAAPKSAFFTDASLFSLAIAGALLAFATFRAPRISTFLQIFSFIFAAEFIVFTTIFLAGRADYWPAGLAVLVPPVSLPVTVAVFGVLVWAIDPIPVVKQITRLADPYFESREKKVVNSGIFPPFTIAENRFGTALVATLVLINQAQVAITVRLNFFNRDWFNAIQKKDAEAFWTLLYTVFLFWAIIYIASYLIELFLTYTLQITWRRWMTEKYSDRWLGRGGIYKLGLIGEGADNPDQRISEDIKNYINHTFSYSIQLLFQISTLVSFSIVLWTIPAEFTIPGTGIVVPGLLFWVALVYATVGTYLTHMIGRRLVGLEFRQERFEADFRFSLARLREYGEQIALLRGENAERSILASRFRELVINFYNIVRRTLKLETFTSFYGQISPLLPYIVIAPYYFLNRVTLGQMTQTAQAFGRVESAMTFFVLRYRSLAAYKAIVDRLTTFGEAVEEASKLGTRPPYIEHIASPSRDIVLTDVQLKLPNGREIVRVNDLTLHDGVATLVTGPSGSGKSTMFRAIAGIWPYGEGRVAFPNAHGSDVAESVMLLPQRPYIANGPLKQSAAYPAVAEKYTDEQVREALTKARLEHFANMLDIDEAWSQRMSGGEQQRLSIAHALLARPDWLFLDEATSALDETLEREIYLMLREEMPDTTLVSIGHRSTLVDLHDARLEMQAGDDGIFRPVLQSRADA